jgi:hypothetical protein
VRPPGIEWGGRRGQPTGEESAFAEALNALQPGLDYWLHQDADGTPWLLISLDFTQAGTVHDTLRLDFDVAGIRGGWSPAFLNWDDGVRADCAGIDTTGPGGIRMMDARTSPAERARLAADWFEHHRTSWPVSQRSARWHSQSDG